MKITVITFACLLTLASAAAQEKTPVANSSPAVLEAHVQKLWAAFKTKDKAALAASLSDDFRELKRTPARSATRRPKSPWSTTSTSPVTD